MEKAMFAAGCFWCVEDEFRNLPGVKSATSGYSGGHIKNPTYEDVCTDESGHAEVILVEYDPSIISYDKLVEFFWSMHDPTTLNRQGPDEGTQYRSGIYYYNDNQRKIAESSKKKMDESGAFSNPIVTEILPAAEFYRAEEYHQQYFCKMREKGLRPPH